RAFVLRIWWEGAPPVPPPPSFMLATYTSPVTKSPVICTSRKKVLLSWCGVQVRPLSVETRTKRAPPPILKSLYETYMCPKKGEDVLLSAQPDSRSSKEAL